MRSRIKWAAAILLAALFGGRARIRNALKVLLGILKDPSAKVSPEIYQRRLRTCQKCPVFYKPLQTCGSPIKRELRGVGCYCYQPESARYTAKCCWLDEELGTAVPSPFGWYANGCATGGPAEPETDKA